MIVLSSSVTAMLSSCLSWTLCLPLLLLACLVKAYCPFLFTSNPYILACKGNFFSFLPLLINWSSLLCCLCYVALCLQPGQPVYLNWYFLHKHIIQPPHCFPYLLLKYSSDDIVMPHMCILLNIMCLPVLVTQVMYEYSLRSLLLGSTITLYIHGLPSSH